MIGASPAGEFHSADALKQLRERIPELRPHATWGTFGPNGDQPMETKLLDDLETDHLENILATQRHIPVAYSLIILEILKERYREGFVPQGA